MANCLVLLKSMQISQVDCTAKDCITCCFSDDFYDVFLAMKDP